MSRKEKRRGEKEKINIDFIVKHFQIAKKELVLPL
jgi:hypothetical protein